MSTETPRRNSVYRIVVIPVVAFVTSSNPAPASAAVGNLFFCESTVLGSITVNMNFAEWFDDSDNRGEARFGSKRGTYELDYKGKTVQLFHKGNNSRMLFPDGTVLILKCDKGGSGQTPGQ